MRIALGNDHRGYPLKMHLAALLTEQGHEVVDLGAHSTESSDHPLFARAVGELIASGGADRGILTCGSGLGVSIAANKVPGVVAALVWNAELARLARKHNGANVLCLAADFVAEYYAAECVLAFLEAEMDHTERYVRRRGQIAQYEGKALV